MSTTAVVGTTTMTDILNSYSSQDGMANYLYVANILARKLPLLQHLPMVASNQVMSEIVSRVKSMGSASTRNFNEYVSPSAAHREPFTERIMMVDDWSQVDAALYDIQNDPEAWRSDEDSIKVEGMSQTVEDMVLNGNLSTDPSGLQGILTRFNLSTGRPNDDSTARYNVQLAGGSDSDVASVIFIETGRGKVYGIYPKNSKAGLDIQNKGKVTSETSDGLMDVYRTHLQWFLGLVIKDERCVQLIRNIKVSGSSNIFDSGMASSAMRRLPSGGQAPGTIMLVSPSIMDQMDQMADDKQNVKYEPNEAFGGMVTKYKGIPVYVAEMLDETETAIS